MGAQGKRPTNDDYLFRFFNFLCAAMWDICKIKARQSAVATKKENSYLIQVQPWK